METEKEVSDKAQEKTPKKKEQSKNPDFIKWFSELDKTSGSIVGGKGANLGEIYNLKIPVPQGFAVTAQAYDYYIKKAGLDNKIKEILEKIDYEKTEDLNKFTKEIREMIEKAEMPPEMEEDILEAYEALGAEESKLGKKPAHEIIETPSSMSEDPFVAVRSSATTEDLAEASFAGQQDTFLNVKGKKELLEKIKKCFSSLFTPRATYYRNKKGFKHEQASLSVIIQKMVDSDKSGVIFSKDPSMKKDNVIIEAVFGLGEGIVSGQISPDRYVISKSGQGKESELKIKEKEIGTKKIAITRDSSGKKEIVKLKEEKSKQQVLKEHEIITLSEIALKLEDHYKKPQDIEFAIENNEIYIVQTRPITTLEKRGEVGAIKELSGEVVLKGLAASPGIGSGKIRIVKDLSDLGKVKKGDILVTEMTNPDMVVTMQRCAAIVTNEGGLTAHASIVSREMGIPAIVGTQTATTKLKDGEVITVDGYTGKIYKGKIAETAQKEIKKVTDETKIKLKVLIDLPSFAQRAAKTGLKKVGLARLEGIIAESGKHPQYFLKNSNIKEYEEMIFKGLSEIAEYFEEIWVRTSDIRSDEFQNLEGASKEIEKNPMLGMHGIRYSLKHPEILKAELNAMKRVFEKGSKIGILAPQIISVEDIQKIKSYVKEIGFTQAKVGVMVETPASVQIIKELCEEGIDFISFGTNDLTQYTLALDRGNEQVQNIYNEMHPAILHQLEYVIKVCKEKGVETSICGQAGSKKEMVKFLVEKGIDSISVNSDMAADLAAYISKLEREPESEPKPEEKKEPKPLPPYTREKTLEEDENKTVGEEAPTIKGAELLEEMEEEIIEPELGVINEVRENVEEGAEAMKKIVEEVEEVVGMKPKEETESEQNQEEEETIEQKPEENKSGEQEEKEEEKEEGEEENKEDVLDIF